MKRLVILAPNWLGDAVMALPAIADVRRASPSSTMAIAARPAIAPLFSMVPGVDETIVLQPPAAVGRVKGWRSMGAELAGKQFDTAILLPNSMHAALIASRAGIAERWGYRSGWRGRLLTRAVRRPSHVHQAEYYRHLVGARGRGAHPRDRRMERHDAVDGAGTRRGVWRSEALAAGVLCRAGVAARGRRRCLRARRQLRRRADGDADQARVSRS